mgnify:CR=1 FL=1
MILHSAIARVALAAEPGGRHSRATLAGQRALRRALVMLAGQLRPGLQLAEEGFGLDHGPRGEPTVVEVPPGFPGARESLRVSVSHTRAQAWALAAIEADAGPEPADG